MRRWASRRAPSCVFASVLLAALAGAPAVRAAAEFPVNTYTTGFQFVSSAARLAGGDFVIVWDGSGASDADGAFGRRFTATGVPVGPEFRLNTYTTSFQYQPAVAADPSGGYVAVWSSREDGNDDGIVGQRYDALGAPVGPPFLVNTFTPNRQYQPAVAVGPAGQFVVAWSSFQGDGNHFGVKARRYDATGAPQGGEFQVNVFTGYIQWEPTIAFDGSGRFVVAWTSYLGDGDQAGIFGRRYDASGAPLGGEFQINTYTTGLQRSPEVAVDTAGNFVVVWASYNQDGSKDGVFAQRYDATGAPQGGEFRVNTYTTEEQTAPRVAWDGQGNFVVSWWSDYQDGSSYGVFARRFRSDGNALGPEFRLNTYTSGQQFLPALAMAPDGAFLVAWVDGYQQGVNANVYARIIPDLIFADGLESASLAAWSAASTDGGDLSVTPAAAMVGTRGLQGVVDDTAGLYVQDDSPEDEGRYRARFYVDPNGFDPGESAGKRRTRVFIGFEELPTRRLFAVVLRRIGGQYALGGRARRDDNSQADTGFFSISDAPHAVEIAWSRAGTPDANDGTFEMWIDGAQVATLGGLDNHASAVDFARLGALSVKATATGTLYWDAFDSRRASYIGP
jgi:hypothetical protein